MLPMLVVTSMLVLAGLVVAHVTARILVDREDFPNLPTIPHGN